jgi:hypothetical protein
LLLKLISPDLGRYFYRRDFDQAATRSLTLDDVYHSIQRHMGAQRTPERIEHLARP